MMLNDDAFRQLRRLVQTLSVRLGSLPVTLSASV